VRAPSGHPAGFAPPAEEGWTITAWPSGPHTCTARLSDCHHFGPHERNNPHPGDLTALGISRRGTLAVVDVYLGDDRLITAT
jgi:hypothetical protein